MQGLSKRQQEILEFIEGYIANKRYSPSFREIQNHFGFSSLGTVYSAIQILKRKKALSSEKGARSFAVTQKLKEPLVEIPLIGKIRGGHAVETFAEIKNIFFPTSLLPDMGKLYYFLQAQGNDLAEEMILDQDLLLIEPKSHFSDGETVIIQAYGMTTLVKKAYSDSPFIRLESSNTQVAPLILREEHVQIQGSLVTLIRQYGK